MKRQPGRRSTPEIEWRDSCKRVADRAHLVRARLLTLEHSQSHFTTPQKSEATDNFPVSAVRVELFKLVQQI